MPFGALMIILHLATVHSQFYRNNTLPGIKYEGPLPPKLVGSDRHNLITQVSVESLRPNAQSMVMIFNVEDRSKKLKNSTNLYRTVVVGYLPFNDRKFIDYFALILSKSTLLRLKPYRTRIHANSTLHYLEERYLNQTREMFQFNMEQSRKSENRKESLGLQIYATYPGTRRCLAGFDVAIDRESAKLRQLDKCCHTRSICQYQSDKTYEGVTTPKSADNFRRTLCECDEEYRSCLTSLNSPDSAYMGDLIYNVLELQCFHPTCNGETVKSYKRCRGGNMGFTWELNVRPFPDVRLGHREGS